MTWFSVLLILLLCKVHFYQTKSLDSYRQHTFYITGLFFLSDVYVALV